MGNNGVGDGRKQIGCTVYSERRMGGNGADVWCCRRKVYRLSGKTTGGKTERVFRGCNKYDGICLIDSVFD